MSVSREEPSISGDLFLVVASWFLRRSGSRVSILIACRRTVPVALSLCVNPMPSRITRKSTRPRVADRTMVDTVQPRVLASFRNRSALSLLMNMQLLRWSKAKPETTGQDTRLERHSYLTRDWMPRTINPRFRRREKNVLDIPSYRTGDYTQNHLVLSVMAMFQQQFGQQPRDNYFTTHTTNVNSSFSSCPVISQQPGVGNG